MVGWSGQEESKAFAPGHLPPYLTLTLNHNLKSVVIRYCPDSRETICFVSTTPGDRMAMMTGLFDFHHGVSY